MSQNQLCTNCGYQGKPKTITKGSIIMELALWICFLLPGLIYSIWRLSSRYEGCPECDASNMVPLNSPIAQRILHPGATGLKSN